MDSLEQHLSIGASAQSSDELGIGPIDSDQVGVAPAELAFAGLLYPSGKGA